MKNYSNNNLPIIIICIAALILLPRISKLLGLIFSLILGLTAFAILAFCLYVAYTAVKNPDSGTGSTHVGRTMTTSESKVLSEGRAALTTIRTSNLKIVNPQVKAKIDDICKQTDQIMANLSRNPENIGNSVDLLKVYLPQLAEIISKYTKLQGASYDTATDTKLLSHLDMVSAAMAKKFENAVSGEQTDLTAEMDAMMAALNIDGLSPAAPSADIAEDLAKKYENQL